MNRLPYLILIFLLFPLKVFAYLQYNSGLSYESRDFIPHRSLYSINDNETVEFHFDLIGDNEKNFKWEVDPRIKVDFFDSSRNRFTPNAAYFLIYGPHLEFSAGLEMIRWGVANAFNPTDIINRMDFEDFYYDPDRLSELVTTFQASIDQAGPLSQLTFQLGVLPLLQEAPLPEDDTRFSLAGNAGGIPYSPLPDQEKPDYIDTVGAFLKISTTIKNTDIAFDYYHGPERSPAFQFVLDDRGRLRLNPFYYDVEMLGLNISSVVKNWGFHLETNVVITSLNDAQPHDLSFEDNNAIPSNHIQFVPGVDYTIHNIGQGDLKLTAEYLGENNHENSLRDFRPFKNDAFLGLQYDFNNTLFSLIKLGVIKDLNNRETIGKLEVSTKIYKELKLDVEGLLILKSSSPNTPLSYFENNSSIMTKLSYSFGARLKGKEDTPHQKIKYRQY